MFNDAKLAIAGAVGGLLLLVGAYFYVEYEKHQSFTAGEKSVQKVFDAYVTQVDLTASRALAERLQENERDRLINDEKLQEAKNEYKTQLAQTISDYSLRIAIDRANGGLRIAKDETAATSSANLAGKTEAQGTIGTDAANDQGSIRLPERIEIGLYAIAEKGAECQVTVTALQNWIKNNGFYP